MAENVLAAISETFVARKLKNKFISMLKIRVSQPSVNEYCCSEGNCT